MSVSSLNFKLRGVGGRGAGVSAIYYCKTTPFSPGVSDRTIDLRGQILVSERHKHEAGVGWWSRGGEVLIQILSCCTISIVVRLEIIPD